MENERNTVLLIDSDPLVTRLNRREMTAHGYRVPVAENISQAKALIEKEAPDLIIMEVALPDGNGLRFCAEIRGSSDIPVMFLSLRGKADDEVAGYDAGCNAYVAKPCRPQVLMVHMRAMLRLHRGDCRSVPESGGTAKIYEWKSGLEASPLAVQIIADKTDAIIYRGLMEQWGYEILQADSIGMGRELLEMHSPDLIIIEDTLPDGNSFDFCKELRDKTAVPIILIDCRKVDVKISAGLAAGANDYFPKYSPLDFIKHRLEGLLEPFGKRAVAKVLPPFDSAHMAHREIQQNKSGWRVKWSGKIMKRISSLVGSI